jgi:cysteine synthase B
MAAFGAKFVLTPQPKGMEGARDIAGNMQTRGEGVILDQFANDDNPLAHYDNTGREIWEQTKGRITHFVSSMGTTGTIMGVSKYLKFKNPSIEIIGCQPTDGSQIPGIRKWPKAYLPKIFESHRVDRVVEVSQSDAEETTRRMAKEEGIFAGISAGGAMWVALQLSETLKDSTIVSIVCDRGDRYLSTGVFPAE